jgi:hypothetical protein
MKPVRVVYDLITTVMSGIIPFLSTAMFVYKKVIAINFRLINFLFKMLTLKSPLYFYVILLVRLLLLICNNNNTICMIIFLILIVICRYLNSLSSF